MASILSSLRNTVITGFVLAGLLVVYLSQGGGFDQSAFVMWLFRWFHVLNPMWNQVVEPRPSQSLLCFGARMICFGSTVP